MITKAQLNELANQQDLRPTTVEKDYVLGWLLYAIAHHDRLARWIFKGGTCLKKCFFETYRFSEDLDFTIPRDEPYDHDSIASGLTDIAQWVEEHAGVQFPREGIDVEGYTNKRGHQSFRAKMTYVGPLNLPRRNLQRVKFDLTQDELVADDTDHREVFHIYDDDIEPRPKVRCYSVNEVIAEKTRALYEREGRARDVYDLVHLSRNFREAIDPEKAIDVLKKKFAFKELPVPTVESIVARVDAETLRPNWQHQLGHQLPALPPVEDFLVELHDSIAWWLQPEIARGPLPPVSTKATEQTVPRQLFPVGARIQRIGFGDRNRRVPPDVQYGFGALDKIRYAARNHLCARVVYHGVPRIVEPYSLRYPKTGNTLLYVHEVRQGGAPSGSIKAFTVHEIESAAVTEESFAPRYIVEL